MKLAPTLQEAGFPSSEFSTFRHSGLVWLDNGHHESTLQRENYPQDKHSFIGPLPKTVKVFLEKHASRSQNQLQWTILAYLGTPSTSSAPTCLTAINWNTAVRDVSRKYVSRQISDGTLSLQGSSTMVKWRLAGKSTERVFGWNFTHQLRGDS